MMTPINAYAHSFQADASSEATLGGLHSSDSGPVHSVQAIYEDEVFPPWGSHQNLRLYFRDWIAYKGCADCGHMPLSSLKNAKYAVPPPLRTRPTGTGNGKCAVSWNRSGIPQGRVCRLEVG